MARLTTLVGRRRDLWAMAAFSTALPIVSIGTIAFLAQSVAATPMVVTVPGTPTPAELLLPPVLGTLLLASAISWVATAHASINAARRWAGRDL